MKNTLLIFTLIFFFACEKEESPILKSTQENLLGNWINIEYFDSTFVAHKASELDSTQYCFNFETDNIFSENKNIGWCGTPPIAYGQYKGSWSLNDSIITIETPYWGGTSVYTWKIISIDDTTLEILVVDQVYTIEE